MRCATRPVRKWHKVAVLVLVVAVVSCGEDRPTLAEYVERINGIVAEGRHRAEAEYVAYRSIPSPTAEDTRLLLERELDIRLDVHAALVELDPPEAVSDLHRTLVDWHAGAIEAEGALTERAGVAGDWTELAQSEESLAYDALLGDGLVACRQLQAELDATTAQGAFVDTPWIPRSLMEVVEAVLGCDTPLTG